MILECRLCGDRIRVEGRGLEAELDHIYRFHPELIEAWIHSLFKPVEEKGEEK